MTRKGATAIGFIAVLLWSFLALFTVGSAPVPPLQLNAICLAIGGSIGLIWCHMNGGLAQLWAIDLRVYVFGTLGIFGYHFLYFSALRMAPAAEAGLIAYLWPLLIVLFSGLLPGETLRRGHFIGALMGLLGAGIIMLGAGAGSQAGFQIESLAGYLLALCCALTWSGYSVLSRRLGDVPTASVALFCMASALLSLLLHLAVETPRWPDGITGWGGMLLLGLGPVGAAFYVWDIGVKQGDIQLLGTSSYAAPLLSTLVLILAGIATPSWGLALAAVCIAGGAMIAARASGQGAQ